MGQETNTQFKLESLGHRDCLGGGERKYEPESECKCLDKIQQGKFQ